MLAWFLAARDECKLKLLEIFYSNANKEAFEIYANELAGAGKRNDVDFWAKVMEMGGEICRDSALFSDAISSTYTKSTPIASEKIDAAPVDMNSDSDSAIEELDFDLGYFDNLLADAPVQNTSKSKVNDIVLDLETNLALSSIS